MNVERLQERLDKNSSYRKKEIQHLTLTIKEAEGSVQEALLRASFILLYAHWEGFTKDALRLFLKYLNKQKIPLRSIVYNLQTLHHTKQFIDVKQAQKKKKYHELTQAMLIENTKIFKVKETDKNIISTESNLKFEVIEDLLFLLDIEPQNFLLQSTTNATLETKKEFIDKVVLNQRNGIAHGETLLIKMEDYEEVRKFILDFMDALKDAIIDISIEEKYLLN